MDMVASLACDLMLAGSIASAGTMIVYSLGKRKRDTGYEEETTALRRRVGDLEALVHERVGDQDRRVGGVKANVAEQTAAMARMADGMEAMSQETTALRQRVGDLEALMDNLKTELSAEIQKQASAMQTVVDDSKEELTKQILTRADDMMQERVLGQAEAMDRLMQDVQALRIQLCELQGVPASDVA